MLPRVKIIFANGALGQVAPTADGVLGLIATGITVAGKFALNTPYILRSFNDLSNNLGITETNNAGIYKLVKQFYDEAPEGTEVWLYAVADTVTLAQMADKAGTHAPALIKATNGKLRGLIFSRTPAVGYTPTITTGLDADVFTALENAQALGVWAEETLKSPMFCIVEGRGYNDDPATLLDLTTKTNNRAAIFIGNSEAAAGSCIGILAGRIAGNQVHRNIGRVADGKLNLLTAYVGSKKPELADVDTLHDKGYITLRTHVGRAGYFFTDDPLATLPTDDYHNLTARRTIDKAYRIGYDTLLNELLNDVAVLDNGTVAPTYAKAVETAVENAIVSAMTSQGELGNNPADQNDKGVICYIDYTQNIVSTGILKVTLKVKPKGYAKYINVELGFKAVTI